MFQEFPFRPRSPRHFVALCFLRMRTHPEMARQNLFLKMVCIRDRQALFQCAYGFFWVDKTQNVTGIFFRSQAEAWQHRVG